MFKCKYYLPTYNIHKEQWRILGVGLSIVYEAVINIARQVLTNLKDLFPLSMKKILYFSNK